MKKIMMAAALAAGMVSVSAQAQSVAQKSLSLTQANALATAAIQACTAKNYQVTVTVVDRAGIVKAVERTDNAGPHTVKASEPGAVLPAVYRRFLRFTHTGQLIVGFI
jgi:hypothetical protein